MKNAKIMFPTRSMQLQCKNMQVTVQQQQALFDWMSSMSSANLSISVGCCRNESYAAGGQMILVMMKMMMQAPMSAVVKDTHQKLGQIRFWIISRKPVSAFRFGLVFKNGILTLIHYLLQPHSKECISESFLAFLAFLALLRSFRFFEIGELILWWVIGRDLFFFEFFFFVYLFVSDDNFACISIFFR